MAWRCIGGMNRILSVAVALLVAISVHATDRFSGDSAHTSIATTGRIIYIDAKTRTMRIRGSEGASGVVFSTPTRPASIAEYTLVTTRSTTFQDGADTLHFEDFQSGETISIRGCLTGTTLTASRVAKWE